MRKGWFVLCLVGVMLSSCSALRPVSLGLETWTVEAKMVPGIHRGMMDFPNEVSMPVIFLDENMQFDDQMIMAVVYHTRTYASAVRVRDQLLAMGMVRSIRVSSASERP